MKTLMQEALENAYKEKRRNNRKLKVDTSGKKQREAENIAKNLDRKTRNDKLKKTDQRTRKVYKTVLIPKGLKPYQRLKYALENGYLDKQDPKSHTRLPVGANLPLLEELGNGTFELYRIYPGMRALVFEKKVGNRKFIQSVKFYRTMSVNTKMSRVSPGIAKGIVNVTIFAPFHKIHELSLLKADDILSVRGEIRLKKVSGGRKFHNLDITLLNDEVETHGSIHVYDRPKMGEAVVGLNNPKHQGGSIVFKNK